VDLFLRIRVRIMYFLIPWYQRPEDWGWGWGKRKLTWEAIIGTWPHIGLQTSIADWQVLLLILEKILFGSTIPISDLNLRERWFICSSPICDNGGSTVFGLCRPFYIVSMGWSNLQVALVERTMRYGRWITILDQWGIGFFGISLCSPIISLIFWVFRSRLI